MHAASFAYLKDARHIELLARDLMRSKLEETLDSDVDSECASASIGRQEAEKCFVGGCIELFAGSSPSTQQAVCRLFESDLKQRKVSGGGRDASALAMAQQNQLRKEFASAVWHSNPTACSSGDRELPAMIAASWPRLDLSTVGIPLRPSGVNSCTLRANMMITEIIQGEKEAVKLANGRTMGHCGDGGHLFPARPTPTKRRRVRNSLLNHKPSHIARPLNPSIHRGAGTSTARHQFSMQPASSQRSRLWSSSGRGACIAARPLC